MTFDTHVKLASRKLQSTPAQKAYNNGYQCALARKGDYTPEDISKFLGRIRDDDTPYADGWRDALNGVKPQHE